MSECPKLSQFPPDGVEWHNRWAELENARAVLERQNQSLQKQVSDLKGALHEKMQEPQENPDEELRKEKLELQQQVDRLLSEEVRKEEKIARLAKELEQQTSVMSEISQAKYALEFQKSRTESELLPLTAARDRLEKEKQMKDGIIEDLRKELAASREEQDQLFREKFEMTRELRRELEASKAETSYQLRQAEEAFQGQYREKKLKEDLERKLQDLSEDFAAQKAVLEDRRKASEQKAQRSDESLKKAQAQLADQVADLKAMCKAREELAEELATVKGRLEEECQKYRSLSDEHEDFLRRRVPGADELPSGYESVSELVRIAWSSREEALSERKARENLQQVLQDIEREIRQRYPMLMSQNQELKELRAQNAELKEQNKIIYQKAREYAMHNRDAEARAKRCERSQNLLEGHAQDLTRQLAVLLFEKNRQSNVNLAASRQTWFKLNQAEEEEWPLSSVQELVEQNVALRKAVRQLEVACEEEDMKEKELERRREQELEDELEAKALELKELTSQLEEVKGRLADVSEHRDAALRKAKALEAREAPAGASAPVVPVRSEASGKVEEELRLQVAELQKGTMEAARSLATKEATLDFEQQRRKDLEESSKQVARQLKEAQEQVNQQSKFIEDLREEKCIEEGKLREAQQNLRAALLGQGEVDAKLQAERLKGTDLEKRNSLLVAEKQLLEGEIVSLQTRISQERESLKKDLEEQYKKQEDLFLSMSKKSQEDIARLQAALVESREKEVQLTSKHFEEQNSKLEAKLSRLVREAERRPGSELLAEAEAQLERSESMLQQPLQRNSDAQQAEREEQHRRTVETWKNLLAQQSADLRNSKAEQERLETQLEQVRAQLLEEHDQLQQAAQRDQARAGELAVQLEESRSQALGLRGQLEASAVELETAKLDWEQKTRGSTEELERLEREKKELQEQAQKAEQKYQEEVKLHAADAKELGGAQERLAELDRSCLQLKHQVSDLEREAQRAREDRHEELETSKKRMEQSERHAEALSEENCRYRDQLVALSRGQDEESQQVLAEMRKAREIGELERRRLELQKSQLEEDGKAVRAENQSLREQLANEQRENWRLQKDCQLETQSRAKLLQIDMIEDENCRLEAENKAMKEKLEEAVKKADSTTNPLVQQLEVEKKRAVELQADLSLQKGRAEEWKSMYEACKFKEEDIKRWEAQEAELNSKVSSLEEKLSAQQAKLEEEQQNSAAEKAKAQELVKAREELQSSLKSKEAEFDKQASSLKAVQNLKQLHTKRIHDLEEQSKRLTDENQKLKSRQDTTEDVKQLQRHADTAMHLAIEYRAALEAVLPEVEKMADRPVAAVSQEPAPKEAKRPPQEKAEVPVPEAKAAATQEEPEPVKRKEAPPQPAQAERAPKAARTEGPPVKKAPAAPKAQQAAAGAAASGSPVIKPETQVVVDVEEETKV